MEGVGKVYFCGMKIAGFNIGGEKDEATAKPSPTENGNPSFLEAVLEQLYAPTGTTEERICKTTADIAYELEMTIPGVAPMSIAKVLHKKGYRTQVIDGTVCWVLYEKIDWGDGPSTAYGEDD